MNQISRASSTLGRLAMVDLASSNQAEEFAMQNRCIGQRAVDGQWSGALFQVPVQEGLT